MITGQLIAVEARRWLGTRFRHQGRVMKTASHAGGVDCLGLLIGVAKALNLHGVDRETGAQVRLAELDSLNYGHRPDGENLRRTLERYLNVVDGEWLEGDILLCNLDGNPQHLAIVGSKTPYTIIHAYAGARCVVEHGMDDFWLSAVVGGYRINAL